MKEEKELFNGRKKCIYCGLDNFSADIHFSNSINYSYEMIELDKLSEESGRDFLSVLCNKCTVSLFLTSIARMMSKDMIQKSLEEEVGHRIISKALFEIVPKYNARSKLFCMRDTMNWPIDKEKEDDSLDS